MYAGWRIPAISLAEEIRRTGRFDPGGHDLREKGLRECAGVIESSPDGAISGKKSPQCLLTRLRDTKKGEVSCSFGPAVQRSVC